MDTNRFDPEIDANEARQIEKKSHLHKIGHSKDKEDFPETHLSKKPKQINYHQAKVDFLRELEGDQ